MESYLEDGQRDGVPVNFANNIQIGTPKKRGQSPNDIPIIGKKEWLFGSFLVRGSLSFQLSISISQLVVLLSCIWIRRL